MRLRNVRTTNGVESFFGTYKKLNDHEILTIDQCVHSIVLRYKMLISKSLSIKKNSIPEKLYKGRQIGEEAMTIIKEQYDKMLDKIQLIFLNKLSEEEYLTSCKCSLYKEFGLPCEHILFQSYKNNKKPLVKEEDIPKIYFQIQYENESVIIDDVQNVSIQKDKQLNESYSYSKTMSDLSIIAEDAKRNLEARKIITDAINDHKKLLVNVDANEPPQIKRFGRSPTFPSRNVNASLPKTKKRGPCHCSYCKEAGHRITTCPKLQSKK